MVAILGMGVVVYAAATVVDYMGYHDEPHRYRQEPKLVLVPYLLQHQEQNASQEYEKGKQAVMVFSVSMVHRPGADGESQKDHEILKCQIFNYIDPEYGQTCQ
jgi:hypothetical protein